MQRIMFLRLSNLQDLRFKGFSEDLGDVTNWLTDFSTAPSSCYSLTRKKIILHYINTI